MTIKIVNYRQFVNIFCCGLEECAGRIGNLQQNDLF